MDDKPLFEIRDISFYFGQVKAIDGLSLTIPAGCFLGILGPNGCGKSTLLELLAGCRKAGSGTIKYRGRDIRDYPARDLAKKIAFVPQDFYIDFSFTVKEIVLMGRHPYIPRFASPSPRDLEIVDQVMGLLNLEKLKDKYITGLSGGEKQRVIFARALAQDTPVLLLDEATSNMDIRYTLEILDIVAMSVKTMGKTVVAAIHDLNLAAVYCDMLAFMKSGRVVSQGSIDDVLTGDNLRQVFGIKGHIYFDDYAGSKRVIFARKNHE